MLGGQLAYMVMAVQYIDTIQAQVTNANGVRLLMETPSVHTAISTLYGMTFSPRGREAVVRVITMGSNCDNILALCRHSSEDGKKDMKKSAIRGYASEILLMVMRSSDNVQFLKKYATQLLTIGSSDSHSKLSELVGWCSPLADPMVFTEAGISILADLVRQRVDLPEPEEIKQTKSEHLLSSELVTSVRLLNHHVSSRDMDSRTKPRQVVELEHGCDGLRMDASYVKVQQIKLSTTALIMQDSTFPQMYKGNDKLTLSSSLVSVIIDHALLTFYQAPELIHPRDQISFFLIYSFSGS